MMRDRKMRPIQNGCKASEFEGFLPVESTMGQSFLYDDASYCYVEVEQDQSFKHYNYPQKNPLA